jgi:hypothetical protein
MSVIAHEPVIDLFRTLLARRCAPSGSQWLEHTAIGTEGPLDIGAFLDTFTVVARRIGTASLAIDAAEAGQLASLGLDWPIANWTIDELGRVTLLLAVTSHAGAEPGAALVEACYRNGDNRERQAVLHALPLLPDAERFLALGLDACRSHVQPIFDAIACENPYPVMRFPDLNWHQLVLKALFTGVPLTRIWRLPERVTPELVRMANDYLSERKAAGRSLPDIGLLTAARGSGA